MDEANIFFPLITVKWMLAAPLSMLVFQNSRGACYGEKCFGSTFAKRFWWNVACLMAMGSYGKIVSTCALTFYNTRFREQVASLHTAQTLELQLRFSTIAEKVNIIHFQTLCMDVCMYVRSHTMYFFW